MLAFLSSLGQKDRHHDPLLDAVADGLTTIEELGLCLWLEVVELTDEGLLSLGAAGAVLAKDIGILGLDGNEAWATGGIMIADDGVHCGLVAKVVLDVGVQVLKVYFGNSADGYRGEDGLHYLCDDGFLSFMHELDEWVEEVEGHGLAGEEVVEEAVLFDGLVLLLACHPLLGVLECEGGEEVLASLLSTCNHTDL